MKDEKILSNEELMEILGGSAFIAKSDNLVTAPAVASLYDRPPVERPSQRFEL